MVCLAFSRSPLADNRRRAWREPPATAVGAPSASARSGAQKLLVPGDGIVRFSSLLIGACESFDAEGRAVLRI